MNSDKELKGLTRPPSFPNPNSVGHAGAVLVHEGTALLPTVLKVFTTNTLVLVLDTTGGKKPTKSCVCVSTGKSRLIFDVIPMGRKFYNMDDQSDLDVGNFEGRLTF